MAASLKDRSPRWLKSGADQLTRRYAMATVADRPAPDFLIIGTKRGGTTSLFNYLLQHPGILGLYPQNRGKKSTDYFFKELPRGDAWYRSHFHSRTYRATLRKRLGYTPVGGEASPYYMWDPRIAPLVAHAAPQVKAIALVRDPVERAYSHYQERKQNGVEPLTFTEALAAEEERTAGEVDAMMADSRYYSSAHDFYTYRARGLYLPQLQQWADALGRDQLLVLRSEDMYADVNGVFAETCRFLGLPEHQLARRGPFNARHRQSDMPDADRAELTAFYAPHNAALEEWLGRPLDWSKP
ncbi:MAG: sulfotransferase [Nocardioidaceae bacterium]